LIPLLIGLFFFVEHPIPGKWVTIPAGPFIMGMDQKEADYAHRFCMDGAINTENCLNAQQLLVWSGRQQNATLKTFSIMDNEVTFAQYQQCVDDQKCVESDVPAEQRGPNLPATHLTWTQAETYCEWLGGRLPTEAEWEKAARGPDGNYYPWGSPQEWGKTLVNIEHYDEKKGVAVKISQFSKSDLSMYGVKNMAGNVEEWTASECVRETCFKKNGQAFSNPVLTLKAALVKVDGPARRVIVKGGSWLSARSVGIASVRQPFDLNNAWDEIGFRCACPAGADCKYPWAWWRIWPAQN
jgi:formylglycine-generating enzyme required for sulfatase activity